MTPEEFQELDLREQVRVWIETKSKDRSAGKALLAGYPHPAAFVTAVQQLSTSRTVTHRDDSPQGAFLRSMDRNEDARATVMFRGRPAPTFDRGDE